MRQQGWDHGKDGITGWDGKGWYGIGWDAQEHRMGWEHGVMGWDVNMGSWDGMGWDGIMRWDRVAMEGNMGWDRMG